MALQGLSSSAGTVVSPMAARQIAPAQAADAILTGGLTARAIQQANAGASSSQSDSSTSSQSEKSAAGPASTTELSAEARQAVSALATRDRQVRAHEQAHIAAASGISVSPASYSYQKGPDGVNYAIGGEVSIDVSPGRTPEESIARARAIQAAALAPADPSGQDRAVAGQAAQMEAQARAEQSAAAAEERAASQGSAVRRRYFGEATPRQQVNTYA